MSRVDWRRLLLRRRAHERDVAVFGEGAARQPVAAVVAGLRMGTGGRVLVLDLRTVVGLLEPVLVESVVVLLLLLFGLLMRTR